MLNLEEYVNDLQCKKVKIGDKHILKQLESFYCGDSNKKGVQVSLTMLERLKKYIQQDSKEPQIHDLYYVICDENDIFLFFSLQSSLVFSAQQINPDDIHQLKCVYESARQIEKTGYREEPEILDFRNAMEMLDSFEFLGLKKYYEMNDNELRPIMSMVGKIISYRATEKQNNLYVDQIIPSIELVNFCKNHNAEKKWIEKGFVPALVPTLFWYKILPIICDVSKLIGCVYVSLFAADVSDKETDGKRTLLHYYENAYSFMENDNLCAIKPYYDWECVFLCQEIKTLVQKANKFKKSYLSALSEDDV